MSDQNLADPPGRSPFYKSSSEAFNEDVRPRMGRPVSDAGADSQNSGGWGIPSSTAKQEQRWGLRDGVSVERGSVASVGSGTGGWGLPIRDDSYYETQSTDSNFGRGFGVAGKQLKQTGYGTAALVGDTLGVDSLRQWGLKGYQEAQEEIKKISKESDSFTSALETGEIGSWLTYNTGYLLGQVAELGAASLAGALVGSAAAPGAGTAAGALAGAANKSAVQSGIRGAVGKMIDKRAAEFTAQNVAKGMALEAAERQAAQQAITSIYRTIGATTANTFLNATQELGSIYGEAVEEAAKTGQEYSLGKVWLSGLLATAVDTWADSKAVGKLMDSVRGGKGVGGIVVESLKGGFREGMTEGIQTAIERWGADKDLATKEAFREYIDSAAVGFLGGSISGGVSGGIRKVVGDRTGADVDAGSSSITNQSANDKSSKLVDIDETVDFKMSQEELKQTLSNSGFMAALYQQSSSDDKQVLRNAVERAGLQESFGIALSDPAQISYGAKMIENNPDFVELFKRDIESFAMNQPVPGTYKIDKRGSLSAPKEIDDFEGVASQEGFTLRERPKKVEINKANTDLPQVDSGMAAASGVDDIRFNRVAKQSSQAAANPPVVDESQKAKVDDNLSELTGDQPKQTNELVDSLANLADVLADVTGSRKNITGQKYTVADLPDALTKVMAALIKEGYKTFKEASSQLMNRMRANKDWSGLADQVDQNMLLKAWNQANGATPTQKQRIQAAPEGPAATLRSQTRAVKTVKGDQLITNQNPINARQFYMSPEEVAANERRATETRDEDSLIGPKEQDKAEADSAPVAGDFDGLTMTQEGARKGKINPAASYYRQALREAKTLLSGRVAMVSAAPGKKPKPTRLNGFLLDGMGFNIFNLKLLDDSSGSGARKLAAIRDEMNRNAAAAKAKSAKDEARFAEDKKQDDAEVAVVNSRAVAEQKEKSPDPVYSDKVRELKKRIDGFIREATRASFFADTISQIEKQLVAINQEIESRRKFQTDDGASFAPKRGSTDENPGIYGYRDENAYDRFEGGMVYDKTDPLLFLLQQRKQLSEDLTIAVRRSQDGKAKLYQLGMDRITDYILKEANLAIQKGANDSEVRAMTRPYLDGLGAISRANEKQVDIPTSVDAALERANEKFVREMDGRRAAMGLLNDYIEKKLTKKELESLEHRGIKDGDFTYDELIAAYSSLGVSPRQQIFSGMRFFSASTTFERYVAENNGAPGAVDAYFLDMLEAKKLLPHTQFLSSYTQRDRESLDAWLEHRKSVVGRKRVTRDMRESLDPLVAFDGFLFTRITLAQARNSDLIPDASLRQAYKLLFTDLEQAWFGDLATALRRRPDLAERMFGPVYSFTPNAATASDVVISLEDKKEFDAWVQKMKSSVETQARVMARVPYFSAIRNEGLLDPVTTIEGYPMVASTPKVDVSRSGKSSDLESQGERAVRLSAYEELYVKTASDELTAVQQALDSINRLKAVRSRKYDLVTGELLSEGDYDQLASDAVDSALMNAQMESAFDQYGKESSNLGAAIRGDSKVVRTIEEAAERDAQTGGQVNASLEDLSSEEQIQEGNISEFEGESTERSDIEEEIEEGAAEQGMAAEKKEEAAKGVRVPVSLVPGMEYRFRRGVSQNAFTITAVQDIVNRLTSGWKNSTNVVVLPNAQHLPEPLRTRVIQRLADEDGAKGLYHNGTVYLFSQHLEDANDVEFTLFHEAYGHLGLRAFLGEKFDQFLEMAYRTRPEVKKAADELVDDGMARLEAIEEVLSDMAAENKNVSIVKQWAGKIISLLREIGFTRVADWFATLTDSELYSVLASARDAARNGETPALNGQPDALRFNPSRLPYEMFATRDGKTTGYARYNPITNTWAVFTADADNIKSGYRTTTVDTIEEVAAELRSKGKVEYRRRSGLFVDDKIVSDLVDYPASREDEPAWSARNSQIRFQNQYLAAFELVDYLASKGRINERTDVKTALTLYESRTGRRLELFREKYVEPIMNLAKQASSLGISKNQLELFLIARHTEERNRRVASLEGGMQDGASGLTYKQADEILEEMERHPAYPILREIGALTDKMSGEKIRYMSRTGMITKESFARLSAYKHYINLSDDDNNAPMVGVAFNVKGTMKRALGRGEGNIPTNVLEKTFEAFEAEIIRGQKNLVAQKILALIEENYGPSFAIVNALPIVRQLNPETGAIEHVVDQNYIQRKDVMVAKIAGVPVTMEFKDKGYGSFGSAVHGLVDPSRPGEFIEYIGKYTRFLSLLLTTYNPAFTGINFLRDTQNVYLNAVADGRITKEMAAEMMRQLPDSLTAAINHASKGTKGAGANPAFKEMLKEMQDAGGMTYFANRLDITEQSKRIQAVMSDKSTPAKDKVKAVLDYLEFLANVSEIAPRLAAYKVARENGWPKEQAAIFSLEITVNFNMRGRSPVARALYLFFNPAVQSGYKHVQLLKTPGGRKKYAAIVTGLFAFGFLSSMIGRALSGTDDDGVDKIDKVPIYKRATSVVLFADSPLGSPIPVPLGWNAFFSWGVFAADSVLGKQPVSTSAVRSAKAAVEAFSPVGSGAMDSEGWNFFLKLVSPTLLLPAVELSLNENRAGAPIYKEDMATSYAQTPNAQKYFRSVSPISRGITDGLTWASGGDQHRKGKIDFNPEVIDHLIGGLLPGLPSEVYRGAGVGVRALTGEEIKKAPWPVVDRFSARIPTGYDAGAFRRAATYVETLHQEYKNTRDDARREEIRKELPEIGRAHAIVASTTQQVREIRKELADIDRREMTRAEKVERKNELSNKESEAYKKGVVRLLSTGETVRERMLAND